MSQGAEVVCEGWLRKSPPEKKLRRYAWKKRWFMLRSGRLSGEPDVLQYFKNPHSRRPIGTIDLNLCEQVDAGLSFTKKELEKSFVFDLKTEERTWYLVAESEDDMNRWVASICLLCGFNPTQQVPGSPTVAVVTQSAPPPRHPVSLRSLETSSGHMPEDYLWLAQCQSGVRPPEASSPSLDSDNSDHLFPPSSSTSSSSSPVTLSTSLPSSTSRTAPWVAALSQPLDCRGTPHLQRGGGKPRCHASPHPKKHSMDFHLRPVDIPLSGSASILQPAPALRPSSTPSLAVLNREKLCTSSPTPPPRPPKPVAIAKQGQSPAGGCESLPDRAGTFNFSESFNSYFLDLEQAAVQCQSNKGMVLLGSVCTEDEVDENYAPMSAATTEPPFAARLSEASVHHQEANYVHMTPVATHHPAAADPQSYCRQVPALHKTVARETEPPPPPPIHRDLKPQCNRKPAPLNLLPVQQNWQEVPPPVHSPVTRTFTRDPPNHHMDKPTCRSSPPSSDSDDPDDSYVAMTTAGLGFMTGEPSLRLMLHRASEGGASSPLAWRATANKQVEYLDLDLYTVRSTPTRQKRCPDEVGGSGETLAVKECSRGMRVDYVVVDPKRTKALKNTREAWHDGRMSTEKCKEHS
ncbi:GRB2-associated-binding protein 1-like isoform X2 [Corythoichthys intestinalis]|uniref:GRB2-associated-binding protein 1-like isoform X2 n=1 Tax=Corythoichthys intestinalis TaxID=161448 RepID=UPI0025A52DC8|nr:GRB2-associated-binding protein 1-like isoform X2 [Corythoichthys intestinalis]